MEPTTHGDSSHNANEPITATPPPNSVMVEPGSFSWALDRIKTGYKAKRATWKNALFVYLVPGSNFVVNRPPLLGIYPEGTMIAYNAHIDVKNADGTCGTWAPSNGDALASDWEIVE